MEWLTPSLETDEQKGQLKFLSQPVVPNTKDNFLVQARARYNYLKWVWKHFDNKKFVETCADRISLITGYEEVTDFHKAITRELNILQVILDINEGNYRPEL